MKGNIWFIVILIAIILVGGGGYAYKNGYISFSNSAAKDEDANKTTKIPKQENGENSESTVFQNVLAIVDITDNLLGETASIRGKITSRFNHDDGHTFLTVEDSTGSLQVPIFNDKDIDSTPFQEDVVVYVKGTVDKYNGELEIIPQTSNDIKLATEIGSNNENSDAKITEEQEGQRVNVTAQILSKYAHPEGHLFLNLKLENGQEIEMPIFSSLQPDSDQFPVNSKIQVNGTVTVYNENLQIVPDDLAAIQILEKGNDDDITFQNIKDISEENRGQMVITEGFVKDIEDRNDGHLFFFLEKDGQRIKTVLFRADSDEIKGRKDRIVHAERAQFPVRVVAMVEVYEGELELIVDKVLVD